MKQQDWIFDCGFTECSKVFLESFVIFQLFVLFLLISEKDHENIVYG